MAKHDEVYVAGLPMSGLIDGWPGKIKGELDRRTVAGGYTSRSECVYSELDKERRHTAAKTKSSVAPLLPQGRRRTTLENLSKDDHKLVQSIRTAWLKAYRNGEDLPIAGDWSVPPSEQFIVPEVETYLEYMDDWYPYWRLAKDVSKAKVASILRRLARADVARLA